MMRYLTAGESHGPALTAIIEGLPSNLPLSREALNHELFRRQQGYGRGGRMKIEQDRVKILSGLRFSRTLGSPLTIQIINRDYDAWQEKMVPFGERPETVEPVTCPRPGHADLPGVLKYNLQDVRDVLERASARETAVRVAVGAVAKELLKSFGISIYSYVQAIGDVTAAAVEVPEVVEAYEDLEKSPVRCPSFPAVQKMMAAIDRAKAEGDTLGGVFIVFALGVPVGLGSHVQWDRRLDARLAAALMSIHAVKGVEIGEGFAAAAQPGSLVHDEIYYEPQRGYCRRTNRAGGLEGGITNGEPLYCRVAVKPIPTLYKPLASVDMDTRNPVSAAVERSDTCVVPAAAVVGEAVVAWELAAALREKLGGDSLQEMLANYRSYRSQYTGR